MKLYNSIGPNPHAVRMFAAEKGVDLELVAVDLRGGENRQGAHLSRNPWGQTPSSMAMMRIGRDGRKRLAGVPFGDFLDAYGQSPGLVRKLYEPVLIGATPEARAVTRMWTRRVDLNICEPLTNAFRFSDGLPIFKDRVRTIPEAAPGLKATVQEQLAKLEGEVAGRDYIAGDRLTLADILLFAFLAFGAQVGQTLSPDNATLATWYARMAARPSAGA